MNERIKPDYHVQIQFGGDENIYAIDPKYDRIDRFTWLGANILRVITEQGVAHIHLADSDAERLIKSTGLPVAYPEFMVQSDYDCYIQGQANSLDDSWLED